MFIVSKNVRQAFQRKTTTITKTTKKSLSHELQEQYLPCQSETLHRTFKATSHFHKNNPSNA